MSIYIYIYMYTHIYMYSLTRVHISKSPTALYSYKDYIQNRPKAIDSFNFEGIDGFLSILYIIFVGIGGCGAP